jgi:hypothetical protein
MLQSFMFSLWAIPLQTAIICHIAGSPLSDRNGELRSLGLTLFKRWNNHFTNIVLFGITTTYCITPPSNGFHPQFLNSYKWNN